MRKKLKKIGQFILVKLQSISILAIHGQRHIHVYGFKKSTSKSQYVCVPFDSNDVSFLTLKALIVTKMKFLFTSSLLTFGGPVAPCTKYLPAMMTFTVGENRRLLAKKENSSNSLLI